MAIDAEWLGLFDEVVCVQLVLALCHQELDEAIAPPEMMSPGGPRILRMTAALTQSRD